MAKPGTAKTLMNFRLDSETINKLDELAEVYSKTRTQIIKELINAEWLRNTQMGKDEVQKLIKQLEQVQASINLMNKNIK